MIVHASRLLSDAAQAAGKARAGRRASLLALGLGLLMANSAAADGPIGGPDEARSGVPHLTPVVQVDSAGVFLDQVVSVAGGVGLPHVRLTNAPPFGQSAILSREVIAAAVEQHAPTVLSASWGGAEAVQVSRRARLLEEVELGELLTEAAMEEFEVSDGELELRLARSWEPRLVPDESLRVRILDAPRGGLRSNLLIRFDLLAGEERVGGWHLSVRASLWKELAVARSNLPRGVRLVDADITLERMDILSVRDPLGLEALQDPHLELGQYLRAGAPVPARAVRVRPVIRRGGMVEGLLSDGLMIITLKVEALQDAVPGQTFRVRNPQNRREYVAKVQDDQTVMLLL